MRRNTTTLATLLLIAVTTSAVGSIAAARQGPVAGPAHVEARPVPASRAPESRMEGQEVLQDAVASAVLAALTEQFGPRLVTVRLGEVSVAVGSIRDRIVSGTGRVRIGDDDDWLGFRFRTLYDTLEGTAGYPQVTLRPAADAAATLIANDDALVRELNAEATARLTEEFAGQPFELKLDDIQSHATGERYVHVGATGIADFGREGRTPASIEALYDRRDRSWVRLSYELGPATVFDSASAIADQ